MCNTIQESIISDIHFFGVSASDEDFVKIAIAIVAFLVIFLIIATIAAVSIRHSDDNKAVIAKNAKILEKSAQQFTDWLVVEFDDGERVRLRNLNPTKILLSPGDVGLLEYQGNTIIRFIRGANASHHSPSESADTWTCPKCGQINSNYVGTCGCGTRKPR